MYTATEETSWPLTVRLPEVPLNIWLAAGDCTDMDGSAGETWPNVEEFMETREPVSCSEATLDWSRVMLLPWATMLPPVTPTRVRSALLTSSVPFICDPMIVTEPPEMVFVPSNKSPLRVVE